MLTSVRWLPFAAGEARPALCVHMAHAPCLYVQGGRVGVRVAPLQEVLQWGAVKHTAYTPAFVLARLWECSADEAVCALLQHIQDETIEAVHLEQFTQEQTQMATTKTEVLPPIQPPQSEPHVKHPENLPDQEANEGNAVSGKKRTMKKATTATSTTHKAEEATTMSKKASSKKATTKPAAKKTAAPKKAATKKATPKKDAGNALFREGSLKAQVFPVYKAKAAAYAKMSRAERSDFLENLSKDHGVAVSTLRTMISGCFARALAA